MKKQTLLSTLFLLCLAMTMQAHSSTTDTASAQWVERTLARLTQKEKVGQLVVVKLSARADKITKRLVREWVREDAIGGLVFYGGTAEEQAILTNLAQKDATVPLLIGFDAKTTRSLPLKGAPLFPANAAVSCITDAALTAAYEEELAREYALLGVHPTTAGQLKENGMELVEGHPHGLASLLLAEVELGRMSQAELDNRCRKALAYKYKQGIHAKAAPLPAKGITQRLDSPVAKTLAADLRRASVTVLCNYFDLLPLTNVEGGIAILSMGEGDADKTFVEAVQAQAKADHYRLSWGANEAARKALENQLKTYRRVIVSIAGDGYMGDAAARFLAGMNLHGALVYAFFTSYHPMLSLAEALPDASAVVLGHSAEADVQQQVARVLFAKSAANGRLSNPIGSLFPAGAGCSIEPGMQPGELIPEDHGMRSSVLRGIDAIAQSGVDEGAYPGCRVLVWKEGRPVYDKGFGTHSDTDKTPVRATDIFDLSTMTKSTATLLAVMKLYDEGKLKLTDKASKYIPVLRNTNKRDITLRQLLLHESGLPPYIRFYMDLIDPNSVHGPYSQSWEDQWHHTQVSEHGFYCSDFKFRRGMTAPSKSATYTMQMADGLWVNQNFRQAMLQKIAREELADRKAIYSDLGFILLQQVVEGITGMSLNTYLDKTFYAPMGLQRTLFLPLAKYGKSEIMPTAKNDFLRRQDLCGYVHDEVAACLGGVSGNAGLFSTAEEVAKIYQMLLNGGEWEGKRYLSEATCRLFLTEKSLQSRRGLGFDKPDTENLRRSPCAADAPASVFGHTGFAGTCVWADPDNNTVYVFLSNRLCPNVWNTKLGDLDIQTKIQELIYKSMK